MHFIVMSPQSHDFLLTSLYIYSNLIIMVVDYYGSLTYECLVLDSELSTCYYVHMLFLLYIKFHLITESPITSVMIIFSYTLLIIAQF